ncbi:unnamed protein product, partial [Onchocerca flexuosa]
MVPKQNDVMVTNSKPQSNHSTIEANVNQSANCGKSANSLSVQVDDPVYDQLKQLPDKLLIQLPCQVIRDAAERLKNVNSNALAGFVIFRTDLRPVIYYEL